MTDACHPSAPPLRSTRSRATVVYARGRQTGCDRARSVIRSAVLKTSSRATFERLIRRRTGDDGAKLQGELATHLTGSRALEPSLRRRPGRQTLRLGAGSSLADGGWFRRLRSFARSPRTSRSISCRRVRGCWRAGTGRADLWTTLAESRATHCKRRFFASVSFRLRSRSILPRVGPVDRRLLDLPLIQTSHPHRVNGVGPLGCGKLGLSRAEPRGLVLGDMGFA